MLKDKVKKKYQIFKKDQKIRFLVDVIYFLTISARDFYLDDSAIGLKSINEIQHIISGQLGHILSDSKNYYPDGTFIDIIFEKTSLFQKSICEKELQYAIEESIKLLENRE